MRKYIILSVLYFSAAWVLAFQSQAQSSVQIGDARFSFRIGGTMLSESHFNAHGQDISELSSVPWAVRMDGKLLTPAAYSIKQNGTSPGNPASRVELEGELKAFSWKLVYEISGPGRVTKTFSIVPRSNLLLETVSLWNARSNALPAVSRTSLQDIAAFYRQGQAGLFTSLDFPYSKITMEDHVTRVTYPPFVLLKKGETYATHTLTIGSTQVTGRQRYGFYEGEVAAMDAYIQERFTPRFDRPMFLSACINNRYTQPKGDIVWYTMKDHPTLNYNTGLLRRELALMPRLGIEYYQVFPGVFDWVPGDPHPDTVKILMDYARSQGVRMGDYSGTSQVFCPHYNNHRNHLDKPGWLIKTEPGDKERGSGYCFGNAEFTEFYLETVVSNAEKYDFEIHCLDFLNIRPCYDESHGHPPGEQSIYRQVRGLERVLEGINSVSPEMMTWSNSGNWIELLPKIAWKNHNLYLTDPFIDMPLQGLNMTRLLDDKRREQMVSLHYSRFIPYRFMTNFQYFLSQNSIVPDLRSYQFGALSTLAVTPNLGLGEIRPWIDSQSPDNQQDIIAFYKHWTDFIKKHYELWKRTYHAGDDPGAGGVEIYSHAEGDQGFIFIVNTSYSDRTVNVPLNEQLGFEGVGSCELLELYPLKYRRLTAQGPFMDLGSELPVRAAARQVLVLEVRPAPEKITTATLYGLPGSVDKTSGDYLLKTQGMQGATKRIAILFPEDSDPVASASVRMDVPKQMERQVYPTPLKLVSVESNKDYQALLMEITFRREAVPTELPYWLVQPGSLENGLSARYNEGFSNEDPRTSGIRFPLVSNTHEFSGLILTDKTLDSLQLGNVANFCGAYIENAFGETQETWITLRTGEQKNALPSGTLYSGETTEDIRELDTLAYAKGNSWWLQTEFQLPFMYSFGMEPHPDEHTLLVLPLFRQSRVKKVQAWLNGEPLNVQSYHYPRNRNLATLYADLVGTAARGGRNQLVLHLQY